MAWRPSMRMFAPMRASSCACMKRFSKMVSVMKEMPSAPVISAMNWACRSVAKPGCSSVVTSTLLSLRGARTRSESGEGSVDLRAGLMELGDQGAEMAGLRSRS